MLSSITLIVFGVFIFITGAIGVVDWLIKRPASVVSIFASISFVMIGLVIFYMGAYGKW